LRQENAFKGKGNTKKMSQGVSLFWFSMICELRAQLHKTIVNDQIPRPPGGSGGDDLQPISTQALKPRLLVKFVA
jgi:hypothetical protein